MKEVKSVEPVKNKGGRPRKKPKKPEYVPMNPIFDFEPVDISHMYEAKNWSEPLEGEVIIDEANDKLERMPFWLTVGGTKLMNLDLLAYYWRVKRISVRRAMASLGVPCLGFGASVRSMGGGEMKRQWFINPWRLEQALWRATGGYDEAEYSLVSERYYHIEKCALLKWLKDLDIQHKDIKSGDRKQKEGEIRKNTRRK